MDFKWCLENGLGALAVSAITWLVTTLWRNRTAIPKRMDALEKDAALEKLKVVQLQEDSAIMDNVREAFIRATEKLTILDEIKLDVKDLARVTAENRERLGKLEGMLNGQRPSL